MKTIIILLFTVITSSQFLGYTEALFISDREERLIEKEYKIDSASTLEVNGKTNINSFCCNSKEQFPKGKISFKQGTTSTIEFEEATLNIQINSLDCGGKAINKDLKKALQADDYPAIQIKLNQLFNLECDNLTECGQWIDFDANSDITIVCTSKSVNIPIKVNKLDDNRFRIIGSKEINLCDFGVEAPTALLGMIKVKDTIEINFDLYIDVF